MDSPNIETLSLNNDRLIPEVGKMIGAGHTVTMTVRGRSMRPFIEDGRDRVLLDKPANLKRGDVILAHTYEKGFVIHRLVRIDDLNHTYTLQGDGNLDTEHCRPQDVVAKVTKIWRKSGGKPYSTEGFRWRLYSRIWTGLRPLRRYLLAAWRRLVLNEWGRSPKVAVHVLPQQGGNKPLRYSQQH